MGYCVPEFRKLSDDELYERGMRNYMNSLVSYNDNLPVSKTNPDAVFYPNTNKKGYFSYPIWILNEKLTYKQYNAKIFEYGKNDVAQPDRGRFDKAIRFLNGKTVVDGLSPELIFSQHNNDFSFIFIKGNYVRFMPYDCCYISNIDELKKYKRKSSKYRNLYENYMDNAKLRKPFWKPYVGWKENFLILKQGNTNSSIQEINGRQKNRMSIDDGLTTFLPISNCGKIDYTYLLWNLIFELE